MYIKGIPFLLVWSIFKRSKNQNRESLSRNWQYHNNVIRLWYLNPQQLHFMLIWKITNTYVRHQLYTNVRTIFYTLLVYRDDNLLAGIRNLWAPEPNGWGFEGYLVLMDSFMVQIHHSFSLRARVWIVTIRIRKTCWHANNTHELPNHPFF